jgi:hypothetical protein
MRFHWRWVLPLFGLFLFFGETYGSIRFNQELRSRNPDRKGFWWATFRLKTDPLDKIPPRPCGDEAPNCVERWSIRDVIVDPGAISMTLLLSALPAFFLALRIVHGLGRLGVNEVYIFFISAPILVLAWYYFLGWLVDRWRDKREERLLH